MCRLRCRSLRSALGRTRSVSTILWRYSRAGDWDGIQVRITGGHGFCTADVGLIGLDDGKIPSVR